MTNRPWLKALSAFLSIGLLISGCAANSGPPAPGQGGAAPAGGIMKVGVTADAVGFDPHFTAAYSSSLVIEQMYNGLLRLDVNLKPEGDLAESWAISGDGLTYTFKLAKGVQFHNGREMKGADVKYSLDRARDTKSPRAYLLEPVKEVAVADDYTVQVVLSKPFAPLLTNLAGTGLAIVPKEAVEKNTDLNTVVDGTGPFKLKEYVPGQVIRLEKNSAYFRKGFPHLDGIEFKPMADETARLTAIRTGELDMILEVPQKDVASLKGDKSVTVVGGPGTWYDYIGINTTKKPFSDVRVRQAMALALDRKAIVDVALFGEGTPIKSGPMPPAHWAFLDQELYKRDVAKAKQLLADAGYPTGFKATLKVGADYKSQVAVAQVVQSQLKDVGVQIEVKPEEWGLFIDEVTNKKDFDLTVLGWLGASDPDGFMFAQFHTGEKWNFYGYSDKQTDDLLEKGRTTLDEQQRKQIYADAQRRVADQAPYLFLHINNQYEALRPNVKGYVHMPTASMRSFHETSLTGK